ncbi:hypothetical protein [Mastigocladopsis repens]|uniref:hypothetical protein n=1 Tax=Mastigocladopsis repens TaxID=221287 RepID=UPI0003772AFA|nr:hypothetical protein [Mastigocladopsis repens]
MEMTPDFQAGQIVSLEHGDRRLYAEVIQVVVSRQLCWVRPLLLVAFTQETPLITDLRDASDLLWSVNLFEPALDTEVISFLSQVLAKEPKLGYASVAKQHLNQFIHEIWQAQKESSEC